MGPQPKYLVTYILRRLDLFFGGTLVDDDDLGGTDADPMETSGESDRPEIEAAPVKRRGRPKGASNATRSTPSSQPRTTRVYTLGASPTVGELRSVLGDKMLPSEAQVTIDKQSVTFSWEG